ncbi:hypothetical protein A9R10_07730 [Aeromonas piscicola]|nr:hypothetical protein A9R10_07730 [Aeromonas piscicola]
MLERKIVPDGSRIELGWNRLGQLIEEKGANGGVTRWRYDERGRQIVRRDPRGAIIRYEWNAADRLQAVYLPGGGIRRFEYHPGLHLVSRRINPDGSVLTYRYDLNGHLSEKVEFGKQETELVTRYERDPMGRLPYWQLPDGNKLSYHYFHGS